MFHTVCVAARMIGALGLLDWLFHQLKFRIPESDAEFWIKLASPFALKFPLELTGVVLRLNYDGFCIVGIALSNWRVSNARSVR